jgi:nucleolar protein 56
MTNYIAVNAAGVWAFDEKGKLIAFKLFPKNAETIAQRLAAWEHGQGFAELEQLLAEVGQAETKQPNLATNWLQEQGRKLALEKGWVKDDAEFNRAMAAVGAAKTKVTITVKERRDRLIVQAVNALGDMDKIVNGMSERLREWYGLHYPEWKPVDHEKYAKLVAEAGAREKMPGFKGSMGMKLADEDVAELQRFAVQLKQMYELRKGLENYLGKVVPEEMPNTSSLVGPVLAARLLAHAGTLERLAKMPSSTMQLLGAEKALFRALKERKQQHGRGEPARVPKFGVIFTHPDISGAPRELQGKIARLLSAKLSVAARTDFYTKEDHSKELVDDYKRKLAEARK